MKKILVALLVCSMLSGCASVVKGRNKNVNIMTSTGEEVEVNVVSSSGMQSIVVPSVVSLKRDNQDITITVKETSCLRSSTSITSGKIEPWFFGNILFLGYGLFGSTTDAVTGAMWTYDDNIVVPVYKKSACQK